jgi:hypothetical protein
MAVTSGVFGCASIVTYKKYPKTAASEVMKIEVSRKTHLERDLRNHRLVSSASRADRSPQIAFESGFLRSNLLLFITLPTQHYC